MPPTPDYAIAIDGLLKQYRASGKAPAKQALKGIDLRVEKGSMFALLGPNGAGKSTLINILAGLVNATGGVAKVWGFDVRKQSRMARSAIGVVPQELNLDAFFTPRELLNLQGGLYGVPVAERRTDELLAAVGLTDKADSYARTLSGGMRRRLMVAKAMVHTPPVLILDEPTAGVDIELRQSLWAYVRELNRQGTTVLLTTHYLEEAQELCDTVAIINHGTLVACEPKDRMLKRFDKKTLLVTTDHDLGAATPTNIAGSVLRQTGPRALALDYAPSKTGFSDLIDGLRAAGIGIADLSTKEPDLQDVFLDYTRGAHEAA
jgi:ABC-2 type transport system ATP-binding protein